MFKSLLGSIKRPKLTTSTSKEVLGVSGTISYGGYLAELDTNSKLQGLKKFETYSNLFLNTAILSTGVRYFINLVAKAEWSALPADSSDAAIEAAKFVDDVIGDMDTSWQRVIRRSCMYRFYGFSIQEWTAKLRPDGRIGFKDIAVRPQSTIDRWDIDENGKVLGVIQRSPQTMRDIYLPRSKLVYLVESSLNDTPDGVGLFRHIVDSAERLKRYETLEGFGFETDLRGVPVARAPLALIKEKIASGLLTKEEGEALLSPLKDFIQNHIKNPKLGLLLDSSVYTSLNDAGSPSTTPLWSMELLNVNSTSQSDAANAITRIQQEMARVLNVEGLMLGTDSKGSHALSKDKTQGLYLVVDSTLNDLKQIYQKDLIDPLWSLNGFDQSLKPKLKTEAIQFQDIQEITSAMRDLATAGAPLSPDDPAINEVRDLLGLSHAPEYDEHELSLLTGIGQLEDGNEGIEDDSNT